MTTINDLDGFGPVRAELQLQLVKLSWPYHPSHLWAMKDKWQMQADQKTEQEDCNGKAKWNAQVWLSAEMQYDCKLHMEEMVAFLLANP